MKNNNKKLEIRKDNVNYGCACAWYDADNLEIYEGQFPTYQVGAKQFPSAYFVESVERVYDPMADFNPYYDVRIPLAGPFPTEALANDWATYAS